MSQDNIPERFRQRIQEAKDKQLKKLDLCGQIASLEFRVQNERMSEFNWERKEACTLREGA